MNTYNNIQLPFEIKEDRTGDIFVKEAEQYINSKISADTLQQLGRNFETAFGHFPTIAELNKALQFAYLFFAEIGETASTTVYSSACSRLSWIIDSDNPIKTAENMGSIRVMNADRFAH